MEFARQQAGYRVLIDAERVPQAVDVAPGDANPRVHLFAVVFPRIAEREQAVGANLGAAQTNEALADVHVAVLDDDPRGAGAP